MRNDTLATNTRQLPLNEEEALALLNMCLFTQAEDDSASEDAMRKLGRLCREFIREDALPAHSTIIRRSVSAPYPSTSISRLRRYDTKTGTLVAASMG